MKLIVLLENFFLNILCLKMFLECKKLMKKKKAHFRSLLSYLKS